ncbi:DUF4233 domain-containing protein [Mycobacterium sp. WMMD1722]|uniref:DUF4233 domain-containing protein n=1 Tax=Mycobacterium sp. WMMD1722 TaxID=3404117 RepID=UPI003BF58858
MTDQPPTDRTPSPPNPWKSFRGVMAGTLILEAIVVLLALPVVGSVGGGLTAASTVYLVGFAVLLVLMSGIQGRPWAIWANLAVQIGLLAGWLIYPGVGVMGVVFTVVWLMIVYLRAEVRRREARGLLPGQQDGLD